MQHFLALTITMGAWSRAMVIAGLRPVEESCRGSLSRASHSLPPNHDLNA
jgi:hypothetical protein